MESSCGLNSINIVISSPAKTAAIVPTVAVKLWQKLGDYWETRRNLILLRTLCQPERKKEETAVQSIHSEFSSFCLDVWNSLMFEWCRLNSFSFKAVACCFTALCSWSLSAANMANEFFGYVQSRIGSLPVCVAQCRRKVLFLLLRSTTRPGTIDRSGDAMRVDRLSLTNYSGGIDQCVFDLEI